MKIYLTIAIILIATLPVMILQALLYYLKNKNKTSGSEATIKRWSLQPLESLGKRA